eukprot:2019352-Amphidinium_carterae.1
MQSLCLVQWCGQSSSESSLLRLQGCVWRHCQFERGSLFLPGSQAVSPAVPRVRVRRSDQWARMRKSKLCAASIMHPQEPLTKWTASFEGPHVEVA